MGKSQNFLRTFKNCHKSFKNSMFSSSKFKIQDSKFKILKPNLLEVMSFNFYFDYKFSIA
jgi:hypothetical protein